MQGSTRLLASGLLGVLFAGSHLVRCCCRLLGLSDVADTVVRLPSTRLHGLSCGLGVLQALLFCALVTCVTLISCLQVGDAMKRGISG